MSVITNLAKAAIAVAATPLTLVVDVVKIIPDSCSYDPRRDQPFSRTAAVLGHAASKAKDAFTEATK